MIETRPRDWHGRLLAIDPVKRFWPKVDKRGPDDCWEWKAATAPWGYGRFRFEGKDVLAHRVAYMLTVGPIPDSALVLHRCDNPPCCNPTHLWLGSHRDNTIDALKKKRRKSPRGERNGRSILTNYDVLGIRKLYKQGRFTQKELADKWGVSQNTIGCIVRYETWIHI